ncbi:MAG: 2-oxoglutarate dehydrogenase complex dihydrolipoyllysine-residue succinyltransferase [Desulfosoma sp.]
MPRDIVIPAVGESVREAVLAEWFVKTGEKVSRGTVLFVLETDKVTLEVPAETDGVVEILVPAGQTVTVGTVVGRLLEEGEAIKPSPKPKPPSASVTPSMTESLPLQVSAPFPEPPPTAAILSREPISPKAFTRVETVSPQERATFSSPSVDVFPSAARLASEMGVDLTQVPGTGPEGKITKGDVLLFLESQGRSVPAFTAPSMASPVSKTAPGTMPAAEAVVPSAAEAGREPASLGVPGKIQEETRKPLSPIRKRIAERLVHAKQSTAMLTTFNEVDMSRVVEFRRRFKEAFKKKYGVSLGFMSFFVKACVQALQEIPEVNAFIDGQDIVYHAHVHMGIAVGAERGLVVPVIKYADLLSFAEIEKAIDTFVQKIQANRLQLSDLEGGTFTISNGGIYGSLLSTPILNPPQSAILGLHKIEDRPIAVDGQVVIRPMMYMALSYDHCIIDGREAVTFLRRVKEVIEDPERLLVGI